MAEHYKKNCPYYGLPANPDGDGPLCGCGYPKETICCVCGGYRSIIGGFLSMPTETLCDLHRSEYERTLQKYNDSNYQPLKQLGRLRPKHVDVDKPTGSVKRLLRRWWRNYIKRQTMSEADSDR